MARLDENEFALYGIVHRTGSGQSPLARYDESALYVLGRPLAPRGYHWRAASSPDR